MQLFLTCLNSIRLELIFLSKCYLRSQFKASYVQIKYSDLTIELKINFKHYIKMFTKMQLFLTQTQLDLN